MSTTEYEEIGRLAVEMESERLKVEAWMTAEGKALRLTTADQCPTWKQYEQAKNAFFKAARAKAELPSDAEDVTLGRDPKSARPEE